METLLRVALMSGLPVLFLLCLVTGCSTPSLSSRSVTLSPDTMSAHLATNRTSLTQGWHSVRIIPREAQPEIHACSKLNPIWWFKNTDDPIPPEWYRPGEKLRGLKWSFRNPMHNFMFYVIGIADREHVRSGRYPEWLANPNGGWNFSIVKYRCLRLPFFAYDRNRFHFYLGWRRRGNFGIKVNFSRSATSDATPTGNADAGHETDDQSDSSQTVR